MNFKELLMVFLAGALFFGIWSYSNDQDRKKSLVSYQKRVAALNRPRILDFYSKTCGPCQSSEPTWNEAKNKYSGQADFFRVEWGAKDPDHLIFSYNVHKLPTFVFVDRRGNEVARKVGWPQDDFMQQIEATINR